MIAGNNVGSWNVCDDVTVELAKTVAIVLSISFESVGCVSGSLAAAEVIALEKKEIGYLNEKIFNRKQFTEKINK